MADLRSGLVALTGRDRELEVLDTFLDETEADGSTLLLTGDPGVGKTALITAAADIAAARGIRVIRGSGVEYESDVSYAGLHQLVDQLGEDLGHLTSATRATIEVAVGIGSGPAPDRLAVLSGALTLFRDAAARAPLLIVVDDLQWLDRPSGAVLGFVGRRLRGSRLGLLGAMRSGVGGFFERAGLAEFPVLPLPEADALELVARQFGHLPVRVRRNVVDEAQGNPLALLEFAASAGGPHDQTDTIQGSSREVRALFQNRVERLPERTRQVLLEAVLDGSGRISVLAATNHSTDLDHLAPAERDHLIVVDERHGEIRFRHPMIRSVVVELSALDERRAAHQRLAEVLADEPERRGHHLAEAAVSPDEQIAAAIEDGAYSTLRRGDVVGAISRLIRAADLSPERRDRSRRLADAAYIGAHSAGQLDSSSELLRAAQRRDPGLGETLHAAVATAHLMLYSDGDAATTHQLLTVALESALGQPQPDLDGLSEGLYSLLLLCHYAGRSEFWEPFHRAMERLADTAPTEVLLVGETLSDPLTASPSTLSKLDHAIAQLTNTSDFDLIVRIAIAGFYTDRLSRCRNALLRVAGEGREGGAVGSAMMSLSMLAFEELGSGHWQTAQETAELATALWEEHGYRLYTWNGRYAMALIAANRGDRASCRDLSEAMFEWGAPRQLGILADWGHHALAEAALGAGDFEDAFTHATAITRPGTLRSHAPQALWSALDLLDAALHTGRHDEARAHASAMREADLGRLSPRFALVTGAAEAMTAPDQAAGELFRNALALPGIDAWPFELARVRLAHGERLRRLRRIREARSQLAAAQDGFERLGALPWAHRATTELAATGATRRAPAGGGLAALTPHEREVADLAASGLSNREIATRLFVSPRTVSAHLYRVYPKLGITSRAALRDALSSSAHDGRGDRA